MIFDKLRIAALAGLLTAAVAVPVLAQSMTPDEAIAARQKIMKLNGKTLKTAGELTGDTAVAAGQTFVDNFAGVADGALWPEDSALGDTKALPAIWENQDKFQADLMAAAAAAAKVLEAAQSGNNDAYKASLKELGGTCKACHEEFKAS